MGEENKGGEKKEQAKEEEKKEEGKKKEDEKKEEEPPEIVLKVDMHCEACARKVDRALRGFEGVEEVTTDSKASRVVVKGKAADPIKVYERLRKKSGRKVELISPLPKPPEENKEEKKEEPPKEEKKDEPPPVVTVALNVPMHCEACAQTLHKRIRKIQGVESVETDLANSQVIVKGVVDPTKLADVVYKKTRKQVSIIVEEKKEEEKKEGKEEQKKDGEEDKGGEDDKTTSDIKRSDYWRSEYWPSRYYLEYSYPAPYPAPDQIFSDENPNACVVM